MRQVAYLMELRHDRFQSTTPGQPGFLQPGPDFMKDRLTTPAVFCRPDDYWNVTQVTMRVSSGVSKSCR